MNNLYGFNGEISHISHLLFSYDQLVRNIMRK